ncbi:C-type lysozyme inhibitor [Erwinia sp. HR93]|uniref:C-type lysozyme inhibitor n=1 Tax=Erwinia sp. HR93 TaxID=3094840 RepID=UPI002ADEE06E|nr:C-type lysozyme inhibitor [Erwinia sp. HR93]MEA1065096.1 C-type lysozyme inhibitor [Erwinia sp. HR93]
MKKLFILLLPCMLAGCSYYNSLYSAMQDRFQTDTLEYQCDEKPLTVKLNNARQEVRFLYENDMLALKQGMSASGTRYTDGVYVFWSKGNEATVYRHDTVVLHNCRLQSS